MPTAYRDATETVGLITQKPNIHKHDVVFVQPIYQTYISSNDIIPEEIPLDLIPHKSGVNLCVPSSY